MGGKALKKIKTRRIDRVKFDKLSNILIHILKKTFEKVEIPMFYKTKDSFGDIDIIISTECNNINFRDYIVDTFQPNEIFHNGNCWSFDYEKTQIDLIITSDEHFESHLTYMGGNDLGNFIGRITQKLGLKYGQQGLWVNHYFKGQKIGKVMVSKDYPKIFEFLGFDYKRWEEGFDTLEDIFEYVIQNKHFDADMFELQHLNKINRERNAKRKSYMSFLDYIHDNHSDKKYTFPDKEISLNLANKFFPEANMTLKIRELEYLHCKKLYIKSKFSGGVIMKRYGLRGKELGNAIENFKIWIYNTKHMIKYSNFDEYILGEHIENIHTEFELFYKSELI